MTDALKRTEFTYAPDNALQNLLVWEFPSPPQDAARPGYWIVYIHGGAWRDPRIDFTSLEPTVAALVASRPSSRGRIAGFASLNYRLSPHPSFPQDPSTTPARDLRHARHPDHIRDVCAAVAFLQARLGFGRRYLLCGHSAGATLAFQVLMGSDAAAAAAAAAGTRPRPAAPAAVVGVEGIYDLVALNARMAGGYAPFFAGAFGEDEAVWAAVSPARFGGRLAGGGEGLAVAALAWSPRDELIDAGEIDAMEARLREEEEEEETEGAGGGLRVLAFRDLEGLHDEVVEQGTGIARVIWRTVEELERLEEQ